MDQLISTPDENSSRLRHLTRLRTVHERRGHDTVYGFIGYPAGGAVHPGGDSGTCAHHTVRPSMSTNKPARPTVAIAAALAGMPARSIFLSAGNAPLSSAEARVAQPALVIWVL